MVLLRLSLPHIINTVDPVGVLVRHHLLLLLTEPVLEDPEAVRSVELLSRIPHR